MAGYSLHAAAEDLLGGALAPRRPAWRRGPAALGTGWSLVLLALSGLATSLDTFVREPIRAEDLPETWRDSLPVLNATVLPLAAMAFGILGYAVSAVGAWLLLRRRMTFGAVSAAVVFGFWSSVLPSVAVIALALAAGLSNDAISLLVALVITVHVVPSLAEMGHLGIGRAFLAYLFGPLLLAVALFLIVLAAGFIAKGVGVSP